MEFRCCSSGSLPRSAHSGAVADVRVHVQKPADEVALIRVARPDPAVPLDAVQKKFPAVELKGIGRRVPDIRQQRVGAGKAPPALPAACVRIPPAGKAVRLAGNENIAECPGRELASKRVPAGTVSISGQSDTARASVSDSPKQTVSSGWFSISRKTRAKVSRPKSYSVPRSS